MWRGEVTLRRTAALAAHLPAGSQVWRQAIHDLAWTDGDYLMATIADALMSGNWQRGGGKGQRPDPVPRPSDAALERAKERRAVRNAEAFMARQRRRIGGD